MRTIICKKCGAEIDASLGECPNCGAVYYILPEEDKKLEWAMSTDSSEDDTKILKSIETDQNRDSASHSTRDILNADNDELFNTRVWKLTEQETAAAAPKSAGKTVPANQRPVNRRPVGQTDRAAAPQPTAQQTQKDKEKQLRKRQLIVSAVALLAVLTLVLSFMGGLFDFSGGDGDKNVMQNVVGMPQDSAMTVLDDVLGLDVTVETEASSEAAGIVIRQSIKENKKVKEGDKVTITVSSGQTASSSEDTEYVEVPTLTKKTYDQARQILTDMGLEISRGDDAFSDEDVGLVVSQSPMKGAKVKKGDTVTVTVSKGLEPSPSPTEHTISVTAGKGGSISPKGAVTVADGEDQTFEITPDSGYEIFEVKVDGTSIGAPTSYTFTGVSGDHTIYAVFRQTAGSSPTPSPSGTLNPVSNTDIG
ncbi:MAG: PASTA domain-containing protein [Oscillospiraceae bacterium]|nr:PASTA domain-containing protein [Oscillospiraceae bacterium]